MIVGSKVIDHIKFIFIFIIKLYWRRRWAMCWMLSVGSGPVRRRTVSTFCSRTGFTKGPGYTIIMAKKTDFVHQNFSVAFKTPFICIQFFLFCEEAGNFCSMAWSGRVEKSVLKIKKKLRKTAKNHGFFMNQIGNLP